MSNFGPICLTDSEREIMKVVRANQPIARSEITKLTSLSQQTVHRLIEDLTQKKLLSSNKAVVKGRGKPSPQIILDDQSSVSVGISVRTDKIEMVAVNLSGDELYRTSLDSDPNNIDGVIRELIVQITGKNSLCVLDERFPIGMGIAMQGYRTSQSNMFTTSLAIDNWSHIPIDKKFSTSTKLITFAENNATCAALAELYCGGGRQHNNLAYLSFNKGFGSGIIWNSQPVIGGFGNAGELGDLFFDHDKAHRPALGELVKRLRSRGVDIESVADLQQKFDPSWPGVAEWLEEVTPLLNLTIRAIHAVIDPEAIYFGGEAPDKLREMLIETCDSPTANRHGEILPFPQLLPSQLKGDAATRGAAILPTDKLIF